MAKSATLKLRIGAIALGLIALAIMVSGLVATPTQAGPALGFGGPNPQATATHMRPTEPPCPWCHTPMPTRTACANCPTATHRPCEEEECRTPQATHFPHATRTPCPNCPPPPPPGTIPPPPGTMPPPPGTRPPHPSRTPRPTHTPEVIRLVPAVQFGFTDPGSTAPYVDTLLNHVQSNTTVNLSAQSLDNWNVTVNPSQVVAHPGATNTIHIDVHVPASPSHNVDVERVTAATQDNSASSNAYLITIARRHQFNDVNNSSWSDDGVQYVYSQNIATGYSDGSFRPDTAMTRAEFAKMLVTAMGWDIVNPDYPTFTDVAPTDWSYGYVETAAAHGVANGYYDGSFQPDGPLTRAQMAKMVVTARDWELLFPSRNSFKDVTSDNWSYAYVETLKSAGVVSGYTNGAFQPEAAATRGEAAQILTLGLYSEPDYSVSAVSPH